jgi:hypothetical protein
MNIRILVNRTIILPAVLYGCKTLSLTLREVHRPRVFENKVLKRIFEPKRDLLTIYTHHSELQVVTAPPLISHFTNYDSTR